jgi:hypothetical protein
MNTDVDRCNRSMLALTNSAVHIPGNGICLDNKNPHSPACNVSVLAADDIVTWNLLTRLNILWYIQSNLPKWSPHLSSRLY